MVLFVVLVVGVRVVIAVRTTGRSGVVSPRGAPRVERLGNLLILLGALGGITNVALGAFDVVEPLAELDEAPVHAIGFALCAIGITGTFAAQGDMGAAWRIGIDREVPTQLVTTGMFRYCRNPVYSLMAVTALGFSLLVPTWLALAALVVLVAGFVVQVRVIEEPFLRAAHGKAYDAYAARVGRFVPGVGRFRHLDPPLPRAGSV